MNARIIAIGDEILIGQTLDTNSNFLATELTKLGFTVVSIKDIADKKEDIQQALSENDKIDLTIITGGLGPTNDDITKNVLSEYFNMPLHFNQDVYDNICNVLKLVNGKMNSLNHNQALFPKGAELVNNEQGTAPCMWFNKNGKITVSMPGVPFEMKAIFSKELVPKLKNYFSLQNIYYQNVMLSDIIESELALLICEWESSLPNDISIAYLPSPGLIKLRLGCKGSDISDLKNRVNVEVEKLLTIVPQYIFSLNGESLESAVGRALKSRGVTVSTAESCTGGNIAKTLTSVPGSSDYFKGSVVAYSNDIKSDILGVSSKDITAYGAVSKQVVEQMALGIQKLIKTDYSVATSGVAGPSFGSDEKPIGTVWIAVSGPNGVKSQKFSFGNKRGRNILRSSMAALNFLRKEVINS